LGLRDSLTPQTLPRSARELVCCWAEVSPQAWGILAGHWRMSPLHFRVSKLWTSCRRAHTSARQHVGRAAGALGTPPAIRCEANPARAGGKAVLSIAGFRAPDCVFRFEFARKAAALGDQFSAPFSFCQQAGVHRAGSGAVAGRSSRRRASQQFRPLPPQARRRGLAAIFRRASRDHLAG